MLNGVSTVEVTNSLVNLALTGNVEGGGELVKSGPGMLTLGGSNSYVGGTLISAGALRMGAGADSGTLGSGNVTNNGTNSAYGGPDGKTLIVVSGGTNAKTVAMTVPGLP